MTHDPHIRRVAYPSPLRHRHSSVEDYFDALEKSFDRFVADIKIACRLIDGGSMPSTARAEQIALALVSDSPARIATIAGRRNIEALVDLLRAYREREPSLFGTERADAPTSTELPS